MSNSDESLTIGQILLPAALLGFALFLSLGFQGVQILRDRDSLHKYITDQDKQLENSHKIQTQVSALALGTKKLADGGDKYATAIIARMQQAGISVGAPGTAAPAAAPAAPAPAAQ